MGRALRTYPEKESAIFCIPINCQDSILTALTSLCFDSNSQNVKNKILIESETIKRTREISIKYNHKLTLIEISRTGKSIPEYKVSQYVKKVIDNGNKLLKQKEDYGIFQNNLIQARKTGRKKYQEHIRILRENHKDIYELLNERAKKSLEEMVGQYAEKVRKNSNKLLQYKDKDYGNFQNNLIKAMKKGERYKEHIRIIKEKYPDIYELLNERANKSPEEMVDKYAEKVRKNSNKLLKQREEYGIFQNDLIKAIKKRKGYKRHIQILQEKYRDIYELLVQRANGIVQ
jgi:histone H3/H4